ncbi:MAG TPA: hypothetical protein VMX54_00340 [Vicinamibacteria bacterium]|nr:hypothetical protein [Vicinamibacteria bacterium]
MARYDQARFRATHNSYSPGRGAIDAQLDCGVRLIEFDIHAGGYADLHDFRLGHLKPGMEVALGDGNPDTPMLKEWLRTVADWSDRHVHAPVTIVLDSKNDLAGAGCGSPEDLNRELSEAFGDRLFTREDYEALGGWPEVTDPQLLNAVLCVLSGDGNTRASYRWAFGSQPALAINAVGDVVLVYRARSGDLHAFLGTIDAAGAVTWQHKSTCCFSPLPLSQPAVVVNDGGWVVAAHQFEPPPEFVGSRLQSIVGRIGPDRHLAWFHGDIFAIGGGPRLTLDGSEIRELHTDSGGRETMRGVLDTTSGQVDWGRLQRATAAPPPTSSVVFRGTTYRCGVDAQGAIVFGAAGGTLLPVRFRQVMFVEEQKGDDRDTIPDALFFAADAKDTSALAAAAARGQVTRAWGFEPSDIPGPALIDATDDPRAAWYQDFTTHEGATA